MFRVILRGINDVDAVKNYSVVETPRIDFNLKTLCVVFRATDDCVYYIDFNEGYNQLEAGISSDDEATNLTEIFNIMTHLQNDLVKDGYLNLSHYGTKVRT
ncbi:MAG: hypothetical protein J6Y02_02555 [Pseudobutyrivibrio sp.]|nr:hypothetical protein [Pseudobutyrivibrio sp.]